MGRLTQSKKGNFPEMLKKCRGNISAACRALDIERKCYYRWCEADQEFAKVTNEIIDDLADGNLDNAKDVMLDLVFVQKIFPAVKWYIQTNALRRIHDEEKRQIEVKCGLEDAFQDMAARKMAYLENKPSKQNKGE